MSGCLLDTNIVSELVRVAPEPRVLAFLNSQPDLWLSVVVLHEMEYGWRLLPAGRRRENLRTALDTLIGQYENRILPLDREAAEVAAHFRAVARQSGRVLHLADALIAGTAKVKDLSVATRNVADFDGLGIEILNPWEIP